MKTLPSSLRATFSCFSFSGIFAGEAVSGSWTSTPFWSSGVTTMKMINSTRQTSTNGVTLMSPRTPTSAIGCCRLANLCISSPLSLHEEVDQLRGGVRHLDLQALDAAGEVVEHPGGRNRDEQAERGGDQRFGDTRGNRADAARAGGGHALERVDDADDGAEQADERRGRRDRREGADAALEIRRGEQSRAIDGAGGGFDDFRVGKRTGFAFELVGLETGGDDSREVALRELRRRVDRRLGAIMLHVIGREPRKRQGLLAGLVVEEQALDRDVQRPDRHDEQDDGDGPGDEAHRLPKTSWGKIHSLFSFSRIRL